MNQPPASVQTGQWSPAARVILVAAAAVLVLLGMRAASDILNSLLLALFVSIGFSPIMHFLVRHGWPVWLSLLAVLGLILVVALVFVAVIVGSLTGLDENLATYENSLAALAGDIVGQLEAWGLEVSGIQMDELLQPSRIIGLVQTFAGAVLDSMTSVLLMLLIIAFMLADATSFPQRLRVAFPEDSNFPEAAAEFGKDIRSYLFIKGWISALAAVPITLLYVFLGTDFALLWGLLFFLFSFIPNIGYLLSLVPPAAVTLLEFGWQRAVVLIVVNLIINTAIDNVVAPRYMGRGLGLSTLVVFLSLILWGWLLGPLGALLSVPMTIMLKRLYLERYEETRFLAEMLGQPVGPHPAEAKPGEEAA